MSEPTALFAPVKPTQVAPRLWRGGGFVAETWRTVSDADAIPPGGHVILSFDRWRAERYTIIGARFPIGVALPAVASIEAFAKDLARFGLISLAFPKFSDGRAYSTARRLRETGFTGELRATGDVLLDQMPLMLRSGFDAFEITSATTIAALQARPIPAVSRVYQTGREAPAAQWRSRRRAGSQ